MPNPFDGQFSILEKVILEISLDRYIEQKKRDREKCPVPEITEPERTAMIRIAENLKVRLRL